MPIDRERLLREEKLYLPESNTLSDTFMEYINELVIARVGDDEDNHAEVLCKALKDIATVNQSKFITDKRGIKRDEVDEVVLEMFEATCYDPWGDFIDSLKNLCPTFGYSGLGVTTGILISTKKLVPDVDICKRTYKTSNSFQLQQDREDGSF